MAMYADDVVIFMSSYFPAKTERFINEYLDTLHEYYRSWVVEINSDKSEYMTFLGRGCARKRFRNNKIRIAVDNVQIRKVEKFKYLGVVLDERFSFNEHITHMRRNGGLALSTWSRAIHYSSQLKFKIKLVLYKQLITSILSYGFPIWFDLTKSGLESVLRFERRCLRRSLGFKVEDRKNQYFRHFSNKEVYDLTNIETLGEFLNKIGLKTINEASNRPNPLLREVFECNDTGTEWSRYLSPIYYETMLNSDQNENFYACSQRYDPTRMGIIKKIIDN